MNNDYFGVATNIGLYVFNTNDDLTSFCLGVVWKGDFECSDLAFHSESKTVFVLSTKGQVVKYQIRENLAIYSDTMDILIEGRAISISYVNELNCLVLMNDHGLWRYDPTTDVWSALFMVGVYINNICFKN